MAYIMLTDLEKTRLQTRRELNPHTRNTNDLRVRKKFEAWVNDTYDVIDILQYLPAHQLDNTFTNFKIAAIIHIVFLMIRDKNFFPMIGKLAKPEEWEAADIIHRNYKTRSVEDEDIAKNFLLINGIEKLDFFLGRKRGSGSHFNPENPVDVAISSRSFYFNPNNQLEKDEEKGVERIRQALKKYRYIDLLE